MSVLLVAVLAAAPARPALPAAPGAPESAAPARWRERLEVWLGAVHDHTPGKIDAPAMLLASWRTSDLQAMKLDLLALFSLRDRRGRRTERVESPPSVTYKREVFALSALDDLLGPDVAGRNRLLERAAVLHADIAMLIVPLAPPGAGCESPSVAMSSDGLVIGYRCGDVHWAFGRALLDEVRPSPAQDETVRLWYHATSTDLLERRDYYNADAQLEHAREVLPRDADVLFQSAYYQEVMASDRIQAAARLLAAQPVKARVRDARSHLEDARRLYGQALDVDPGLAEARVRRGRVLLRLDRADEAAADLRQAAGSAGDNPQLEYYAAMLLGDAERSLGNAVAARNAYERAAGLFPLAQSPRLALSYLSRNAGNKSDALRLIRDALGGAAAVRAGADPWWAYFYWQSVNARTLLARLRQQFPPEEGR